MLNVFRAAIAIQSDLLSKMLEINFVALPAPVETEKQDNRAMHNRGKQDRTGRKYGRGTQELPLRCLVAARDPVASHANQEACFQALLDPEQGVGSIRHDYGAGNLLVKRIEKAR